MNQPATPRKPHIIVADTMPEHYARGWHVLDKASEFTTKPRMFDVFGTRLAVYRGDKDGQVHVLDAYCPHMGADLSKGYVKDDSLVCPFHAWSWGGDGVCNDIPYAKKIPDKAVIKSWPVLEKNGLLFVWNDHENNPPIPQQEPARMEDYYSGEWTDWTMTQVPIESNCRELVDNMADLGHFGPVHYSRVKSFRNIQDGHRYIQVMSGGHEILEDGTTGMTTTAIYEGPAYMTTTMTGSLYGRPVTVHLLVSHYPVHMNKFIINFGVMMKKDPKLPDVVNRDMVDKYTRMSIDSFIQDVEIWDNKVRVGNPVLCDGDGPIHMLRKWYSQFYMNIADVPEELVKHKEHVSL